MFDNELAMISNISLGNCLSISICNALASSIIFNFAFLFGHIIMNLLQYSFKGSDIFIR